MGACDSRFLAALRRVERSLRQGDGAPAAAERWGAPVRLPELLRRSSSAYTARFFNAKGRVMRWRSLDCRNDDEALDRLALTRHPHPVELWKDDRLVWRFDSQPLE